MEFKVGDRVKVLYAQGDWFAWKPRMSKFVGEILTVCDNNRKDVFMLSNAYYYPKSCLGPADAEMPKILINEDI